jgi:hypothetical protein
LASLAALSIIYGVSYPYKEAGEQLGEALSPGEFFYRIGDPTVCFYAKHNCYASESGYDLRELRPRYLSVAKATYERDIQADLSLVQYIQDNYRLVYSYTSPPPLISGNNFRKNTRAEYELIYIRK